ncbi:MAG: SDR family NAD(P)-dependent oxidoreductase, partial [Actinomycetia bacterium]|nr:SDR family NAD(P)-dependent oxidoreductase [Actinomycetes bacterium]
GVAEESVDLAGAGTVRQLAERLAQACNPTTAAPDPEPIRQAKDPEPVRQTSDPQPSEPEVAMRYLPRALVRDLTQSPGTPRDLRGLRLLLLPAANQDLTDRTRTLLEAAGAEVWTSTVPAPDSTDDVDQASMAAELAAEHRRCGPRDGIVDLASYGPFRDALELDTADFSLTWHRQYAQVFSVCQEYFADLAAAAERAVVAVLTNCGGGYGLKLASTGDALGAMTVGFVKSLGKELPLLSLCLVEVDSSCGLSAADKLVTELAAGSDDDEVSYLGDQRHVIKVVPVPVPPAPDHRDAREGAVVFTGGSRGIALECALALASSDLTRGPIVILGRSRIDDSESRPYLELSDEDFAAAQPEIMAVLHREHPGSRPMELRQRFRRIADNRQLWSTIRRLKASSAPIEYLTCDVNDADQVAHTMADIRSRHGGVRGIVHAAGLESLGQLPKKSYSLAVKVVETKLQGFCHLLHAVDPASLDFLVAFTSISGRFGMDGQTEYTAGAAAVSALCSQLSRRCPTTRVVAIDWTAWAGVGMATHHSVQEIQEQQRGLRYMPLAEGCRHFLRELAGGGFDSQVMIFGPLGTNEPRSALSCLTDDRTAIAEPISYGSIVDPGAFPMIETRSQQSATQQVFTRRLDPRLDGMLTDHLVKGSPTLPGVFHLEAMAEAARLATGRTDLMIELAEFQNFVKCPEGRVCDLEITVSTAHPDCVETSIRADVVSPGGVVLMPGRQRSHAVFVPRRTVPSCPFDWGQLMTDRDTQFDLGVYYVAAEPIITFGPSFRMLQEAWRTSTGVLVGRFDLSADTRALLPEGTARLRTEPLLIDNVGRLGLIDIFHRFGDHVVPVNVSGAVIQQPAAGRTEVVGCVEIEPEGPGEYAMRLRVADLDGTPLIEVDRILLQRLNKNAARRSLAHAAA